MKNLIGSFLLIFCFSTMSYASFPVDTSKSTIEINELKKSDYTTLKSKSKINNKIFQIKRELGIANSLIKDHYSKSTDGKPAKGMAITGFVLSLVGLLVAGIILGILAVIFSAIALSRISNDSSLEGKGMAIAGLVIGIVDILVAAIIVAALL